MGLCDLQRSSATALLIRARARARESSVLAQLRCGAHGCRAYEVNAGSVLTAVTKTSVAMVTDEPGEHRESLDSGDG
jgi:hypothetical protein